MSIYTDIVRAPDGDVLVAGYRSGTTTDLVVTRLDPGGAPQWSQGIDDDDLQSSLASGSPNLPPQPNVLVDGNGRVVLVTDAIRNNGNRDILFVRLAPTDGSIQTDLLVDSTAEGPDRAQSAYDAAFDDEGNLYVAGDSLDSATDGQSAGFLARIDASTLDDKTGNVSDSAIKWVQTTDLGPSETRYEGLAIDSANGQVVAAGWTEESESVAKETFVRRAMLSDGTRVSSDDTEIGKETDTATEAQALDATQTSDGPVIVGRLENNLDADTDTEAIVFRLNADHSVDADFGTTRVTPPGDKSRILAHGVRVDGDSGILFTGSAGTGTDEALITGRLSPDGSVDGLFAIDGFTQWVYRSNGQSARDRGAALTTNSDDQFVLAGAFNEDATASGSRNQAAAMAFTSDVFSDDDGSGDGGDDGDDSGGDGGGSGGGGGGGGGGATGYLLGLLLFALLVPLRSRNSLRWLNNLVATVGGKPGLAEGARRAVDERPLSASNRHVGS